MGTRFLPATKTVPKELLPVVDTPGIELVAGEAADSGANRLVIVTSPGKDGVVAHTSSRISSSRASSKPAASTTCSRRSGRLRDCWRSTPSCRPSRWASGHAVGCAEAVLDDDEDAIAVLLPDDLVMPRGVLETMARVRAKRGGSVLCAIDVPKEQVSAYGVFDVETVPDATNPDVLKVVGMVEKRRWRTLRPPSPRPAGTCSTARSSTPCAGSSRARAANSSSPTPSHC
ncbi:hypothetical protein GS482_30995 [Rhodococcus hoagii]|nr:hypothetical protein [Prescottella equi]